MSRVVDELKAEGKYRAAGAAARRAGLDCVYGVHFGFAGIDRAFAVAEFKAGYMQELHEAYKREAA